MTYRGHVKNGAVVLDTPAALPEGAAVRVEVEPAASDFWANKTVDQLAREQGVGPVQNIDDLGGDWPEDESVDDFIAFVREGRR
jgi:hypothetical protein